MTQGYRHNAPRVEDVEVLPIGPAKKCPACRTERKQLTTGETSDFSMLPAPRACSPMKPVSIGLFRRCKIANSHLHESCKNCGHEWLSRFGGAE